MSTCNDLSVYRTLRACQNPCCNLTLHEQTGEYFPNNPRTYEPVLRFRIDEDAAGQRTLHRKQMQICAKKIYTKGSKKAGVFCRVTLYVLLCTFCPSLALPLSLSFSLPLSLFLSLSLSFSLSLPLSLFLFTLSLALSRALSLSSTSYTATVITVMKSSNMPTFFSLHLSRALSLSRARSRSIFLFFSDAVFLSVTEFASLSVFLHAVK